MREGTIVAALLVGFIARVLGKKLEFIKPYLFPEEYREQPSTEEQGVQGKYQKKETVSLSEDVPIIFFVKIQIA